jgi:predicted dehydrogenase
VSAPDPREPLSACIVGAGGIARLHARACRETDGVRLTALCDTSPEALDRAGDEWDVPAARRYASLDALLEGEAPDIAIVSTWGVTHAETGIRLARSGRVRAILCEKPFTSTAAEAEALAGAARARGVLLAEAFKFRHHPAHLELKARVDAGAIGDPVTVRSTFCLLTDPGTRRPERNWRWDRARGGGSLYDLAGYGIHHARYVFGAEPVRVFASAQLEGTVDVAAALHLVFPGAHGERAALLSVGYNLWRAQYTEVSGTAGMLRLDNPWNNEDQAVSLVQQTAAGTTATEFPAVFQFTEQLRHLADCLTTGRPHRIPPENSVAQMRVLDAAFESIRTGRAVELSAPMMSERDARRPD